MQPCYALIHFDCFCFRVVRWNVNPSSVLHWRVNILSRWTASVVQFVSVSNISLHDFYTITCPFRGDVITKSWLQWVLYTHSFDDELLLLPIGHRSVDSPGQVQVSNRRRVQLFLLKPEKQTSFTNFWWWSKDLLLNNCESPAWRTALPGWVCIEVRSGAPQQQFQTCGRNSNHLVNENAVSVQVDGCVPGKVNWSKMGNIHFEENVNEAD